jgi:hypothetical protein
MLQEHGYRSLTIRELKNSAKPFYDSVSLGRTSEYLVQNIQQFSSIMEMASQVSHAPSRFLCMYQIFEVLIEKVFKENVARIIKDPEIVNDPWKIREEISYIANERWRISQINSKHLRGRGLGELTENTKISCLKFLNAIESERAEKNSDKNWSDLMYFCRNYVVHRQHLLIGKYEEQFTEICSCLKSLCFFMIKNFSISIASSMNSDDGIKRGENYED